MKTKLQIIKDLKGLILNIKEQIPENECKYVIWESRSMWCNYNPMVERLCSQIFI